MYTCLPTTPKKEGLKHQTFSYSTIIQIHLWSEPEKQQLSKIVVFSFRSRFQAMLTTFQEVDMSGLIKMRKERLQRLEWSWN